MIFLALASFPQKEIKEAAKAFLALKPLPASIKRQGPYFKIVGESSIEIFTLYEFEPDFLDKAQKFLESRYLAFAEVAGFKVTIEPRLDMQETLLKLQIKP
ncbi:MAG: hypothetical protein ACOY3Z_01195 [Thermodesulfobacteriota bacterium]